MSSGKVPILVSPSMIMHSVGTWAKIRTRPASRSSRTDNTANFCDLSDGTPFCPNGELPEVLAVGVVVDRKDVERLIIDFHKSIKRFLIIDGVAAKDFGKS